MVGIYKVGSISMVTNRGTRHKDDYDNDDEEEVLCTLRKQAL